MEAQLIRTCVSLSVSMPVYLSLSLSSEHSRSRKLVTRLFGAIAARGGGRA